MYFHFEQNDLSSNLLGLNLDLHDEEPAFPFLFGELFLNEFLKKRMF